MTNPIVLTNWIEIIQNNMFRSQIALKFYTQIKHYQFQLLLTG